jgi:hypothetical protein
MRTALIANHIPEEKPSLMWAIGFETSLVVYQFSSAKAGPPLANCATHRLKDSF